MRTFNTKLSSDITQAVLIPHLSFLVEYEESLCVIVTQAGSLVSNTVGLTEIIGPG